MTKQASLDSTPVKVGTGVTYTFTLTNTGNEVVTDLNVDDYDFSGTGSLSAIKWGAWPDSSKEGTLMPTQQVTGTATYKVTQADITAGYLANAAVPAGKSTGGDYTPQGSTTPWTPTNPTPGQVPTCTTTNPENPCNILSVPQAPGLQVTKSAEVTQDGTLRPMTSADFTVGQKVTYVFEVENTGNVPLDSLTINDKDGFQGVGMLGQVTCDATKLAPGDTTECTADYTVEQGDVDAGTLANTATATATPPDGTPITSQTSNTVTVTATAAPHVTLTKTADASGVTTPAQAGQEIVYTYTLTNDGNVTLSGLSVDEANGKFSGDKKQLGDLQYTWPDQSKPGVLAPKQKATATATYKIVQSDIDRGYVANAAVTTGTTPGGKPYDPSLPPTPWTPNPTDPTQPPTCGSDAEVGCAVAPLAGEGAISLVKSVTPTDAASFKPGATLHYSFVVTNTGNQTLTGIHVEESGFGGTGTLATPVCQATVLAPNQQTTCTADYEITAADYRAGTLKNTAKAHGTNPAGTDIVSDPSSATVPEDAAPGLELTKTADPVSSPVQAGTTVTYHFTITNSGNVAMSGVAVNDAHFTGTGTLGQIAYTWPDSANPGVLLPGQSVSAEAQYKLTQADMDEGWVANAALPTGTTPGGKPYTPGDPGVPWTPTDPQPGQPPVCPASATGCVIVGTDSSSSLSLVKTVTPATASTFKQGETLTYRFAVLNTGNQTVKDIQIDESAFSGSGQLGAVTCDKTTLAPGETATCQATYQVTKADVKTGQVQNTATAKGTDPAGGDVTSKPASATVPDDDQPHLTVVKTADTSKLQSPPQAGDVITYNFTLTNDGNVTMHGAKVEEGQFTGTGQLSPLTYTWPDPSTPGVLEAGETATATATYALTQADLNNGYVANQALTTGTEPGGSTPTPSGTGTPWTPTPNTPPTCDPNDKGCVIIDTDPTGSLSLVKSVSPSDAASYKAGEALTYSFVVTNTGNQTLTGIRIDELAFSASGQLGAITCPKTTLQPGEQTTCTATYVVTDEDAIAGQITNSAKAWGTPPNGKEVGSTPSSALVPSDAEPHLSIVKKADTSTLSDPVKAGDTFAYTFEITNDGNVSMKDVSANEAMFTGTASALKAISYQWPDSTRPGVLLPGEVATGRADYTLTQADVDQGWVANLALPKATTPGGTPYDPPTPVNPPWTPSNPKPGTVPTCDPDQTDCAIVTVTPKPGMTMVKSVSPTGSENVKQGKTLTYSFLFTNTGNVTLHDLAVQEQSFSGTGTLSAPTCPAATLAPGAQMTCTATYTVTAADAAIGEITNTAVGTAKTPGGDTINSTPSTADTGAKVVPVSTPVPTVTVTKTAHATTTAAPTPLAKTGAEGLGAILWAAALALIAGFVVLLLARRRRRDEE
ncbi:MAG: DUF11 domain-containing protein [Bifidobacteriaceae bacterium]|jgi:uncharacterized repeat protein (TIGR01451 family)/LPXTG-motif cell wall-anchored protein|nr:DUF11 domain-containing protein [Bifidobacteriaceae bacterium]